MPIEVQIALFSALGVAVGALYIIHYSDRKGAWDKMHDLDTEVTRLNERDHVDYRELIATIEDKISPLESKIDAIAIKLHVEPDRRNPPEQ